jgi:predicted dehydrogenase
MIRLALIGCGAHAKTAHADPLSRYAAQHPDHVQLTACCDLRRERAEAFCQQFGFLEAFTDVETMLDKVRPDAVLCIVPIEQIVPQGSKLLRRGIPCVLEKPLGASPSEVATLVKVAQETQTPHIISVNRRFNPFLNQAITWIKEAGVLQYIHCRMLRHNRCENDFVWGTGVHVIDAMRYIAGEWQDFDIRIVRPPQTSAPWFLISLRFISGCEGRVEIMPTCGMIEETFDLYGDGFRTQVTTVGGTGESVRYWREGVLEGEKQSAPNTPLCLRDGSYEEISAFLKALREGTIPAPGVDDVAPTMDLCARISTALDGKGMS